MAKSKHDQFFSKSMEHPAMACSFFQQYLAQLSFLQLELDKFFVRVDRKNTDANLKQREKDIIYQTRTKQGITVFLLVEHQSRPLWKMVLRLLQYCLAIITMYLCPDKRGSKKNQKWPLVISFLLYHGRRSPYPFGSELTDYYANPLLGNQLLSFRFYITDVTTMSDQEILKHGICAVPKLLFKHCWDGNFELDIEAYRPIFHECIRVVGEDYINSMLDYATSITDLEVGEKLYKFVEEIFQDKQKSIMTYGQFLKQEGIQEGLQTGIANVAKNMLQAGSEIGFIQKMTGLNKETIEKLKPSKN